MVEDPGLRLGNGHRLGQQIVHHDYVDAAVTHLGDEVEMVALGDINHSTSSNSSWSQLLGSGADGRGPGRTP